MTILPNNPPSSALGPRLARSLRGRRVLVTGHTGFKGAWLCQWLIGLGAEVHGLALAPPSEPAMFDLLGLAARMHDLRGDIRDAAAVKNAIDAARPDVVIHMAAQSLVRAGYAMPAETFAINAQGTVNVLEALRTRRARGPVAAIIVTTDKCYRPWPLPRHHDEADPLGGPDPYSASKACAEIATEAYRRSFFDPDKFADHGVALASVRAGNVIGGGDWAADRLVPDIARAVAANSAVGVRNPKAVRPWQHVLDALSGYLWLSVRLMEATSAGPGAPALDAVALRSLCSAWNFGPDDSDSAASIEVGEIVRRMIAQWGQGRIEDASDPRAPHEAPHLGLSIAKARRELGWRPTWGVDRCVAATTAWYKRVMVGEASALDATQQQLREYAADAAAAGLPWAGA